MVPTPLKRNASRSPDGSRRAKRLLTSSPEEGEVNEPNPPSLPPPTSSMPPVLLPPKPPAPMTAKVPFPFKKKTEEWSREHTYDREHAYDRDHRQRRDDDQRRYRRRDLSGSRHYRPSPPNDLRRNDRERTRNDRGYDYGRSDSSHWSPPRRASPRTCSRSEPVSPGLPTISARPRSPPPPLPPDIVSTSGPRPPSATPPPAPPPDPRISNPSLPPAPPVNQLPPLHSHVKIPLRRPNAPKNIHSPVALEMRSTVSTAKAMVHGIETQADGDKAQDQRPAPPLEEPPKENIPAKKDFKVWDHSLIQSLRSKPWTKRTPKEEGQFYGHGFTGCAKQDHYETTTKLGEGTFGEVHKAIHKSTGVIVALKRILMHNEKEGMPVTALREIKILKALKHPSIVNILDMFVVRSKDDRPLSVFMVFPYMDHDLAGLLENERVKLQPSHIKLYMKQLLEGTAYMHRNHILHRDMKAANLLISNNGTLKIADFGLARSFDSSVSDNGPCSGNSSSGASGGRGRDKKYTNCVVTRWYRPPELLLGARHYGGEVDIWGIGCVLGEMFNRRPILPGSSDLDQLERIWFLCGSPNQHNWPYFDQLPGCEGVIRFKQQPRRVRPMYESVGPETVDLMDQLLKINPKERPTAAAALEHDYFWTDPLPADAKTMPSYESSHEFDKRGHRPPQPQPQPMPTAPAGPQNPGPYGGPPGNNPRFNNNNRGPRHSGPDRRHQGLKPPPYPPHHLNHPNIPLPPHPPPNVPAVYPGPGGYHGGPGPGAGPTLMPNMPVQIYVNGQPPPTLGIGNSFGPPPFPNGPPYPLPPQPYAPTTQGYGPPPMNYPAHPPHGYSRRGRGRWEQGPRHHTSQASGNQNGLPKPPPGLPQKPMAPMGIGSTDRANDRAGSSAGAGAGDNVESLSYDW